MQACSHYSLFITSKCLPQIYSATVIKSVLVIAWKAILTVEAAGFSGKCETINFVCLALYRMVAEFKGDWNFEGTSTASNYCTASEFAFPFPSSFPFPFPFPSFLVLPLPLVTFAVAACCTGISFTRIAQALSLHTCLWFRN